MNSAGSIVMLNFVMLSVLAPYGSPLEESFKVMRVFLNFFFFFLKKNFFALSAAKGLATQMLNKLARSYKHKHIFSLQARL